MHWEYFLSKERDGFYTQFLMHLLSLVAIILFFIKKTKTKSLLYLVIIAIASFTESLTGDLSNLTQKPLFIGIAAIVALIYLFIEIIYCVMFIKSHIQSRLAKKIISAGPILLIAYAIILLATLFLTRHSATILNTKAKTLFPYIYIIEGFLIVIPCLYFFYELFILDPINEQIKLPAVWAISGMLILSGTIAPLFLFVVYLYKTDPSMMHKLWAINYIAYCLLFITFIMAIRSDKKQSNQS